MRCCPRVFSMAAWSGGLEMRGAVVRQVVQRDKTHTAPLRCVLAARDICRGERLCVVPESHIFGGRAAAVFLQQAAARGEMADFAEVQRRLSAASFERDPQLLATRDALLIALAVHALRHKSQEHPLAGWAASLPPRLPPMGAMLISARGATTSFEPLQRRLRVGSCTAVLQLGGGDDAAEVSTGLMLLAAEEDGLEHVRRPQVEVAASSALMTAFYRRKRLSLTQRQHEALNAKIRNSADAANREFLRLEESLRTVVLEPLLACISPKLCSTGGDGNEDDVACAMEELRWSHFVVRSRAINLLQHSLDKPQIALVPFLDMLNHSVQDANVAYQYRPGVGVIVAASRPIKMSEELTLNYGDYRQRGCLFAHNTEQTAVAENATAAVRRVESRQLSEWDHTVHDDCIEDAPFGHGLQQLNDRHYCEDTSRQSADEEEAQIEARWLWRFGFLRSDEEKAYIASRIWSKGLRQRIAQLTDVRRKGRPGEFVIGVPEGLRHLREQRERLERERFGGARIFPPQNV